MTVSPTHPGGNVASDTVKKGVKQAAGKPGGSPNSRANMSKLIIYLTRGTAKQHEDSIGVIPIGNFTLVTDRPELRFHDGVTPGGLVIPIPRLLCSTRRGRQRDERDSGINTMSGIANEEMSNDSGKS